MWKSENKKQKQNINEKKGKKANKQKTNKKEKNKKKENQIKNITTTSI